MGLERIEQEGTRQEKRAEIRMGRDYAMGRE